MRHVPGCLRSLACFAVLLGVLVIPATRAPGEARDIVDQAKATGKLTTLLHALRAAGLDKQLHDAGPFTLLAPSDDAFAKLPPGTLEGLLAPDKKEELTALLRYHIVPARLTTDDMGKHRDLQTLTGQSVDVKAKDGTARLVNTARIIEPNLACTNGMIQVIDQVLTRPEQ